MTCLLPVSCSFFAWLILQTLKWKPSVPSKYLLAFTELCSVISQKTELFNDYFVAEYASNKQEACGDRMHSNSYVYDFHGNGIQAVV
jgi:hypothetical protein